MDNQKPLASLPALIPSRSRKKNKTLPPARQRHYVDEPVVVLTLADYERLANHLTDIALLDRKTILQQQGVKERHSLLLREARANIKAARQHYHISSTQPFDN